MYKHLICGTLRSSPACPELSLIYRSCSVVYWLYACWDNCKEVQAQRSSDVNGDFGGKPATIQKALLIYSLTTKANFSFCGKSAFFKGGPEKRRYPKIDQTKKVANWLKLGVCSTKAAVLPAPCWGLLGHTGCLICCPLRVLRCWGKHKRPTPEPVSFPCSTWKTWKAGNFVCRIM